MARREEVGGLFRCVTAEGRGPGWDVGSWGQAGCSKRLKRSRVVGKAEREVFELTKRAGVGWLLRGHSQAGSIGRGCRDVRRGHGRGRGRGQRGAKRIVEGFGRQVVGRLGAGKGRLEEGLERVIWRDRVQVGHVGVAVLVWVGEQLLRGGVVGVIWIVHGWEGGWTRW
jgi:hypothetical protein